MMRAEEFCGAEQIADQNYRESLQFADFGGNEKPRIAKPRISRTPAFGSRCLLKLYYSNPSKLANFGDEVSGHREFGHLEVGILFLPTSFTVSLQKLWKQAHLSIRKVVKRKEKVFILF